jgi:DNA-binding LytR/AlgR family response regulator
MTPMRCMIVDDEELSRTLLTNYIARLPFLHLVGACANPLEALGILREQSVDLLFLDIQMPELTGIEFLRILRHKPTVIFTTAYPDYALDGYNMDVVDYLLKPFSFERFVQAVNKAAAQQQAPVPATPAGTAPARDFIMIKADHKMHRIRYDDILYIQSMREYAAFHLPAGRILSLHSLKGLETELPAERFVRIHKSYIVAIDKIQTLEGNMVQVGGEKLPVGANYRDMLLSRVM